MKCSALIAFLGSAINCTLEDGHEGDHTAMVQGRSSFWPNGAKSERRGVKAIITWADERRCPDDGHCHHKCKGGCFRVQNAGPLSGVYAKDEWPRIVVDRMGDPVGYVL